jgi:hypothetical protein
MTLAGPQSQAEPTTIGRSYGIAHGYQRSAVPLILLTLGAYVVLKPYYLFPSGLPQMGDMLVAMALPFALLLPRPRQSEDTRRLQLYLILFCCYAALVSLGWTFALMDPRVALYATYYAFNLCLMVVCLRVGMLYPRETLLTIAYAIALSAIVQAALSGISHDASKLRQIASFNNPNQLGYWSLLSLCMLWSIAGKIRVKWYIAVPASLCIIYMAAIALSKSAMISIAVLCLLHFAKKPKLLFIGLLALAPAYLAVEDSMLVGHVKARLENIGEQQDDTLEARGYTRIWNFPEYMVVGAGEGALYRFGEKADAEAVDTHKGIDGFHEIHSTIGTILFSYGAVGLITFGAALLCLYRISSAGRFLYLLPPFLHGLTHQGLRFSFLWLLFSVLAILGEMDRAAASSPTNKHRPMTRSKEDA